MQKFRFNNEIHEYQRFVRENISVFGDMLLITEQLFLQNDELCIIDILLLNKNTKRLVVLELKNVHTTDKVIWQPIKYYDHLRRAEDSLKKLLIHKQKEINFSIDEIDFNPEIILVVPDFNQQLLRSLSYVNDVDLKVIKLNLIINENKSEVVKELYNPSSVYFKEDLVTVKEKISKVWSFAEYLKEGVDSKKIIIAKDYINFLNRLFKDKKVDVFFYDKYMSITINGKVWGHIYIKKQLQQSYLHVNFKYKGKANPIDFQFTPYIVNYKILSQTIDLCFYDIPQKLIEKYGII
jgi:hypothetical protein